MHFTEEQLHEIAEDLSLDLRVFIHRTHKTVHPFSEEEDLDFGSTEWPANKLAIAANPADYLEISKWTAEDELDMMQEFAQQIKQENLRNKVLNGLKSSRPHREFKILLSDASEEELEHWSAFKTQWKVSFVRNLMQKLGLREG